jgi:hypothetical protein
LPDPVSGEQGAVKVNRSKEKILLAAAMLIVVAACASPRNGDGVEVQSSVEESEENPEERQWDEWYWIPVLILAGIVSNTVFRIG